MIINVLNNCDIQNLTTINTSYCLLFKRNHKSSAVENVLDLKEILSLREKSGETRNAETFFHRLYGSLFISS